MTPGFRCTRRPVSAVIRRARYATYANVDAKPNVYDRIVVQVRDPRWD